MRHLATFLALALLIALPAGAMADALALIIGNDTYSNVPKLAMARQDSRGYAAMFRARGFRVFHEEDVAGQDMRLALARFYDAIRPGDTVAFVYAGHGWSNGTSNFLLPTDVSNAESQTIIAAQSFDLRNGVNGIVDEIHRRGPGFTLAVIDACRDNPFQASDSTRSFGLTRGLSQVSAPSGTFIAFSAGEGQTALDRLNGGEAETYSVFTRHFLRELALAQDVQSAFKATQLAVNRDAQSVGHNQRPAYYDEVIGEVCLPPGCAVAEPVADPAPVTDTQPPAQTERTAGPDAALEWQDFKTSESIPALELFVERHAGTAYAALARERIAALSAQTEAAETAPAQNDRPPAVQPRWCPAAKTRTERAICADATLAQLDIRMSKAFNTRKGTLSASHMRAFTDAQRDWLKQRDSCADHKPCLIDAYESAIERLE